MIKEAYCSFEVSKLLKEKGFPQDDTRILNTCYKYNGKFCNNVKSMSGIDREICYMAPTHQMAMAYLREENKIFIEISVSIDLNGDYHYNYSILDKECKYIKRFIGYYSSHELCVEAALLCVLKNLI